MKWNVYLLNSHNYFLTVYFQVSTIKSKDQCIGNILIFTLRILHNCKKKNGHLNDGILCKRFSRTKYMSLL